MANRTFLYVVEYRLYENSDVQKVRVIARDKRTAYDKATYEVILEKEGRIPHNSWVHAIQYNNGNYRVINKSAGT